jgi:hypothetical protein
MSIATYRDDDSTIDISEPHVNDTLTPTQSSPSQPDTPLDLVVAFSGCTAEETVPTTHSLKANIPVDNTSTVVLNYCTTDDTSTPTIPTRSIPPVTLDDLSIEDDNDPFDIPRPLFLNSSFQSTSLNPSASVFHPTSPLITRTNMESPFIPDYPSPPVLISPDIGSSSTNIPPPPPFLPIPVTQIPSLNSNLNGPLFFLLIMVGISLLKIVMILLRMSLTPVKKTFRGKNLFPAAEICRS